ERDRFIYGFPRRDGLVKLARHHEGRPTDPDRLDRTIDPAEVASLRPVLERFLPTAAGEYRDGAVCMYANTPDGHFVIGPHPASDRVLVVSACSGHGFKFAPAIGEVLSDLLVEGFTRFDLELFAPGRFAPAYGARLS